MTPVDPTNYRATVEALDALPDLVVELQTEMAEGTGTATTRGKPGSRPPMPIGLLSDLEETWGILAAWARDWAETYDYTLPEATWTALCAFLGRHWPNVADTHPAADEFAAEVAGRRVHGEKASVWVTLARHTAVGQPAWLKLPGQWTCVVTDGDGECGGMLLQKRGEWLIRCPKCDNVWGTEHEVDRLGAMLGCEVTVTVEQAAELARVNRRTVYRWIDAGQLPTTVDMLGRTLVDKRDLAIIAIRRTA